LDGKIIKILIFLDGKISNALKIRRPTLLLPSLETGITGNENITTDLQLERERDMEVAQMCVRLMAATGRYLRVERRLREHHRYGRLVMAIVVLLAAAAACLVLHLLHWIVVMQRRYSRGSDYGNATTTRHKSSPSSGNRSFRESFKTYISNDWQMIVGNRSIDI
jgi:hypothetical protein